MNSAQNHRDDPAQCVRELLLQLRSANVVYFPIRHHSPACGRHIDRWIRKHRPTSVLIEGPESFNSFIAALAHPGCRMPVAMYTNFVDTQQRLSAEHAQPRFAAYYPLCDYSPELIALRTGLETGARIRFADLEFAEKILHSHGVLPGRPTDSSPAVRVDSLTDDPHLAYSTYTKELARRLGCRDFNELWDHLFEAGPMDESTDAFIDRLATFCAMSRLTSDPQQLQSDGTLVREDCMAVVIDDELETNRREHRRGPILVVTGGFHTVALPALAGHNRTRPPLPEFQPGETGSWLIPYSFDRLDALAGYSSGMPSPAFYDRLWQASHAVPESASTHSFQVICDLVLDVGRLVRQRNLPSHVSTPDAIAAVQMIEHLARLRGHASPQREDVLDGIRGCLIKGAMEPEGTMLMTAVEQLLAGDRVGQVPPGTNVPPIVDDFRKLAQRHKLPTETIHARELQLDLYRKQQSREISRLLHQLTFLGISYARLSAGPDFQRGLELERMNEVWQVQWTPATEAGLIEAAVYGSAIVEAASQRLHAQLSLLSSRPGDQTTSHAVQLLVQSCSMGLHELGASLQETLRTIIAIDPHLPSLAQGLTQLILLLESREPLDAHQLKQLPSLIVACYQRACQLTREAAHCSGNAVDDWLSALAQLRELLTLQSHTKVESPLPALDADLWIQALQHLLLQPPDQSQPIITGAATGILYGLGELTQQELIQQVQGHLVGTGPVDGDPCGLLRGLLTISREVAWNVPEVLDALNDLLTHWDDTTFLRVLPDLRLTFADFTPQETHRIAEAVASRHAMESPETRTFGRIAETDMLLGLELSLRVRASLSQDGLTESGNASAVAPKNP